MDITLKSMRRRASWLRSEDALSGDTPLLALGMKGIRTNLGIDQLTWPILMRRRLGCPVACCVVSQRRFTYLPGIFKCLELLNIFWVLIDWRQKALQHLHLLASLWILDSDRSIRASFVRLLRERSPEEPLLCRSIERLQQRCPFDEEG